MAALETTQTSKTQYSKVSYVAPANQQGSPLFCALFGAERPSDPANPGRLVWRRRARCECSSRMLGRGGEGVVASSTRSAGGFSRMMVWMHAQAQQHLRMRSRDSAKARGRGCSAWCCRPRLQCRWGSWGRRHSHVGGRGVGAVL